jgi:N-acetylglutamate synthase-like GNAT family acetyltransferase
MDMFTLRLAVKHDQEIIRRLVSEARINPMGLEWDRFWVAEAVGQVIGACQVKPHKDGSRELASLVVDPDWRGQGIARALVENFLTLEDESLYLTCRTELGPFYEKFGFRKIEIEQMPRYFRTVYRFINAGKLVGRSDLRILVMLWEKQTD